LTIISHKHKFIFIKNPKIAGTSIEVALSEHLGPEDVLTPLLDLDERDKISKSEIYKSAQNYIYSSRVNHFKAFPRLLYRALRSWAYPQLFVEIESAVYLRTMLGKNIFDSYYKFCFERNPYDKVVSSYYHSLSKADHHFSFQEYMNKRGYISNNWHLYTENDQILVDDVYKFESLEDEIKTLSDKLGLAIKLPTHKFMGKSRKEGITYKNLVKPGSAEKKRIDKEFKKEFERFNYSY
jgi:hypothetical protein